MRRSAGVIGLCFMGAALLGCAGVTEEQLAEISRSVAYHPESPPSATLITSQGFNGGGGVHAALMITGSEQVIYDPSGTFHYPGTRRVGDVLYGVTPEIVEKFALHQADYRHYALLQSVPLTQDVADEVLRRARRQGGSWPGFCAANIADVLGDVGPFARVRDTMWPSELSEDFAKLDGAQARRVDDNDDFTATPND